MTKVGPDRSEILAEIFYNTIHAGGYGRSFARASDRELWLHAAELGIKDMDDREG